MFRNFAPRLKFEIIDDMQAFFCPNFWVQRQLEVIGCSNCCKPHINWCRSYWRWKYIYLKSIRREMRHENETDIKEGPASRSVTGFMCLWAWPRWCTGVHLYCTVHKYSLWAWPRWWETDSSPHHFIHQCLALTRARVMTVIIGPGRPSLCLNQRKLRAPVCV